MTTLHSRCTCSATEVWRECPCRLGFGLRMASSRRIRRLLRLGRILSWISAVCRWIARESNIAFALSLTEAASNIGWGILRPVGAVTFIVFFITNLLAKEVALYDQEKSAKSGQTRQFSKDPPKAVLSLRGVQSSATLETAAVN